MRSLLKAGVKRLYPEIATIKSVYKSVCNYLKLADGSGLETNKRVSILMTFVKSLILM